MVYFNEHQSKIKRNLSGKVIPAMTAVTAAMTINSVLAHHYADASKVTQTTSEHTNQSENLDNSNNSKGALSEITEIAFGGFISESNRENDANRESWLTETLDIIFPSTRNPNQSSWVSETLDIVFPKSNRNSHRTRSRATSSITSSRIDKAVPSNSDNSNSEINSRAANLTTNQESNSDTSEKSTTYPLLIQTNPKWSKVPYGTGTIGRSGCGIAALSMVISGLTNEYTTPPDVASWAGSRFYVPGAGSSWNIFSSAAKNWGLKVTTINKSNAKAMKSHLKKGNPIIVSMRTGTFTNGGGHFIVLTGIDENGKVTVNDPNSVERSNKKWDLSYIINQSSLKGNSPFWAFSK